MAVRKSKLIGTIKNGYAVLDSRHEGSDTKYLVRCEKCGFQDWKSRTFVKNGGRCPSCSEGINYHNAKGYTHERLYERYQSMLRRVKGHKAYKNVKVCDEWVNDYHAFRKWALKNGYRDDLTIDRIDNSKGYCADNCRWVDATAQANNRKTNVWLEFNGECHTMAEWERIMGLPSKVMQQRRRLGWGVEDIIMTPYRSRKRWSEIKA